MDVKKGRLKDYHRCIHCGKLTPNGKNQWKIANYIKINGRTDTRQLMKMLKVSRNNISVTIKNMVDDGIVIRNHAISDDSTGLRCMVSLNDKK